MLRAHAKRGLAVGVVGGIVYGAFVGLVGNSFIAYAETFEEGAAEAAVPTGVTLAGSVVAGGLWAVLFGLLFFGVLYYFLEPAIPGAGDTKSYLLGGAGFLTVSGGPWLGLPPQPPGVHQALPTDARLVWYAILMLATASACVLSGYVFDRLSGAVGSKRAAPAAALAFVVLAVPLVAMPPNPVGGPLPTGLVDAFRWTTVFGQAGLWFVLASTHAWLIRRADDRPPAADAATDLEDAAVPEP